MKEYYLEGATREDSTSIGVYQPSPKEQRRRRSPDKNVE